MTSRNQVTAVVLVLVLVGVLDFVTRVYVPRSAAGRDVQFEVAYYQGVLVHLHRTRGITEAVGVFLVVNVVFMRMMVNIKV